jgi:hypothetical protein
MHMHIYMHVKNTKTSTKHVHSCTCTHTHTHTHTHSHTHTHTLTHTHTHSHTHTHMHTHTHTHTHTHNELVCFSFHKTSSKIHKITIINLKMTRVYSNSMLHELQWYIALFPHKQCFLSFLYWTVHTKRTSWFQFLGYFMIHQLQKSRVMAGWIWENWGCGMIATMEKIHKSHVHSSLFIVHIHPYISSTECQLVQVIWKLWETRICSCWVNVKRFHIANSLHIRSRIINQIIILLHNYLYHKRLH